MTGNGNFEEGVPHLHEKRNAFRDGGISPEKYGLCLNPVESNVGVLQELLKPCRSDLLEAGQVGLLVNNPRNNSPNCIVPK
jgi:putative SOS response-associated peptidase YedK